MEKKKKQRIQELPPVNPEKTNHPNFLAGIEEKARETFHLWNSLNPFHFKELPSLSKR
jgi:hypothetical protein